MIKKINLGSLNCSNIAIGTWRFNEGFNNPKEVSEFILNIEKLGINTIDTAQVYGDKSFHYAESLLSDLFSDSEVRKRFVLITKTGIGHGELGKESKFGFYDFSYENIMKSVNNSLSAMNTDYIDLYLLHRPDYFANFEEIAKAFLELKKNKKVKEFGVSNFTSIEFEALNNYLNKYDINLVTNQIEFNPYCDEHIKNGNLYYLKSKNISPMIWSPLAGGEIFKKDSILNELASKYDVSVEQIALEYIKETNTNPIIIYGSNKIQRYSTLKNYKEIKLSKKDVYSILSECSNFEIK